MGGTLLLNLSGLKRTEVTPFEKCHLCSLFIRLYQFPDYNNLKESRNLVLKLPLMKSSFFINCWWKGMVVFTPSITYSFNARLMVLIASSRVRATAMILAIMES